MHPVLFDLGFLQIRSYGFTLAVSFLIGIFVAGKRAKRYGVQPQLILDLSVYIILASVIGSRLLYVLFHLSEYDSPLEFFYLWQGGATFYGGMILAIIVSYGYVHKKNIQFLLVADIVSPSIALGLGVTRVGCLLSGCCFGSPTTLPFGLHFPPESPAGYAAAIMAQNLGVADVALHPTQVYAMIYGIGIFLALMYFEPKLRKRGATFGALLVVYGVARFSVDFVRSYEENAYVFFGLTFNQVISTVLFVIGLVLLFRKTKLRNELVEEKGK